MSIDADLNAGIIDEQEAGKEGRKFPGGDFYGAHGRASKLSREAVADPIILVISAEFIIGSQQNLPFLTRPDLYHPDHRNALVRRFRPSYFSAAGIIVSRPIELAWARAERPVQASAQRWGFRRESCLPWG